MTTRADTPAVWVDKNWRMTFTLEGSDAVLVDYHVITGRKFSR